MGITAYAALVSWLNAPPKGAYDSMVAFPHANTTMAASRRKANRGGSKTTLGA
jgi:hypothetical protein